MTTKAMTGIAIALATLLASPAFAQVKPENLQGAFAQQPPYHGPRQAVTYTRQHSPNPAWDVYSADGHYLGSDPDPNVRQMLSDDPEEGGDF